MIDSIRYIIIDIEKIIDVDEFIDEGIDYRDINKLNHY
jgi:hypothetical protein